MTSAGYNSRGKHNLKPPKAPARLQWKALVEGPGLPFPRAPAAMDVKVGVNSTFGARKRCRKEQNAGDDCAVSFEL